jgi:hypothetical protein
MPSFRPSRSSDTRKAPGSRVSQLRLASEPFGCFTAISWLGEYTEAMREVDLTRIESFHGTEYSTASERGST